MNKNFFKTKLSWLLYFFVYAIIFANGMKDEANYPYQKVTENEELKEQLRIAEKKYKHLKHDIPNKPIKQISIPKEEKENKWLQNENLESINLNEKEKQRQNESFVESMDFQIAENSIFEQMLKKHESVNEEETMDTDKKKLKKMYFLNQKLMNELKKYENEHLSSEMLRQELDLKNIELLEKNKKIKSMEKQILSGHDQKLKKLQSMANQIETMDKQLQELIQENKILKSIIVEKNNHVLVEENKKLKSIFMELGTKDNKILEKVAKQIDKFGNQIEVETNSKYKYMDEIFNQTNSIIKQLEFKNTTQQISKLQEIISQLKLYITQLRKKDKQLTKQWIFGIYRFQKKLVNANQQKYDSIENK